MQRPQGYREFGLTEHPTLETTDGKRQVSRDLISASLELLTVWLDSFIGDDVPLGHVSKLYHISPLYWEPKWEHDAGQASRSYYYSSGWTQIDVDPYGDDGGAGTLHILAEIEEKSEFDYSVLRESPRRKPPFVGYRVTWHIRVLMWDFDTTVDTFWNSTTAEGEHGHYVYAYDADDEMILEGEDESRAVKWVVYDYAPAQSGFVACSKEHAERLPLNGLRPQGVGDSYWDNNPRTVTTKPDAPAVQCT